MGDLQNPSFRPLLTCFPARLAIFMLIPWVRGLDVSSVRAEMADYAQQSWYLLYVTDFTGACMWKQKLTAAQREIEENRKRHRWTLACCYFSIKAGDGELQQFIDFQNGSALIVIPGCWALFIGHTQHLRLWSLPETPQLSQQALPNAHTRALVQTRSSLYIRIASAAEIAGSREGLQLRRLIVIFRIFCMWREGDGMLHWKWEDSTVS